MLPHLNSFLGASRLAFFIFLGVYCPGCTTTKITDPARTATEQLLLSTATDRALRSADLDCFANQRVFLDATYFDSYDSKYALGAIRDALSRAGALLTDNVTNSDVIVEARSGALSIDDINSLFGIPSLAVPVPLAGALQTPEIAFYKMDKQRSTAKIALLAYANHLGAHIYSSGSLDGKSYNKYSRFLFISWHHSDIPEKQDSKNKTERYQSWFPEYTQPSTNAVMTNAPVSGPLTNEPMIISNSAAM